MPYREVMSLPMRVFWQFSGQVDRLRGEEAQMKLEVGTSLSNPESAATMREHLGKVAPPPFKMTGAGKMRQEAQADPGAADTLRSLASLG